MPKIDGKDLKFDFKFDGIPGVDGKKLSEQIRKEIELKMVPLQKNFDPKKIEEIQKQIELKTRCPCKRRSTSKKLGEMKKEIELKMRPLKEKLGDLQKQIEVIVVPDGAKIDGKQNKIESSFRTRSNRRIQNKIELRSKTKPRSTGNRSGPASSSMATRSRATSRTSPRSRRT